MALFNTCYPVLASKSVCTACMACIDSCQHNALSYKVDKFGFFAIVVDKQKCVNCGLCTKHCPVVNKQNSNTAYLKCFSAWSNDNDLRMRSASGGAFAAVAQKVIMQGGVVYGAAIDGFNIRHRRVDRLEDLHYLQGSKYQSSILAGIYKSVKKDLNSGRMVLFSGLGCQINGLRLFLGNRHYDNLFTMDTICGGVASMLPMEWLAKGKKYLSILSFRDKDAGWKSKGYTYRLKMLSVDGTLEAFSSRHIILRTFSSKIGKRSSCLDCSFAGIYRMSDCTIGDFWGVKVDEDEERKGVSALLVHSARFMEFLGSCDIILTPVTCREIASGNSSLYFTHSPAVRYFLSRKIFLSALRSGKYLFAQRILDLPIFSLEQKIYNRLQARLKQKLFSRITI